MKRPSVRLDAADRAALTQVGVGACLVVAAVLLLLLGALALGLAVHLFCWAA